MAEALKNIQVNKKFFIFLLTAMPVYSQKVDVFKPDSVKKEIEAIQISSSLHVDGLLNEEEWKKAKPSPRFTQIEPYQGVAPNYDTDVKVLYNKQYLYFGIFSHDSLGKKAIRAIDLKRDFDYRQHDLINLSFDAFNDQRNAMAMALNPFGVQRDYLALDEIFVDNDWDGLWKAQTLRTDSGWFAEIAIPWETFRYPKTTDTVQNWGFNVYRNRRRTNEITALSEFPRSVSSVRMAYAGVLKNLRPPPPGTNIRIQPYILTSYDRYKTKEIGIESDDTNFKPGGDLKWVINPNTILDLTANTDFAQADVDRQVNNVTRFSVFFPERRQFFLENSSLFGIGVSQVKERWGGIMRIHPFFSRRIGLDDNGNPIPIDAGGRFVARSPKRNYGAILMRQRDLDTIPATNFFVGRFSENLGKQNRIGLLVAVKNNIDGSNITSAVDGFFRLHGVHSLSTMILHSVSTGSGRQGISGYAQYFYSTNQMKIWWTETLVTKDFNPEMGFVSRKDVVGTTPGIYWYYRGNKLPFKKWLRAYEPGISSEFYHQASTGKLIERQITAYPVYLNLQSGGYLGYGISSVYQRLSMPFDPLGVVIQEGSYSYFRNEILASTDPSRFINLLVIFNWGDYYNGKLISGDWTLQFAPIPHISLKGRFNRNYFSHVGEEVTTATIDLYSLEGRFALNPRLQFVGFYQKNSENSSQNYNLRFSWEYKPLSYIYLVFNHRSFNEPGQNTEIEDHAIAKISYLKQF
jgi:hypothetical protein